MTEVERALLIGKAESLTYGKDVFFGLLICPIITAIVWAIWRDKYIASLAAEFITWFSATLTLVTAFLAKSIETKTKNLRIENTVMAYGLTGKYEKMIDFLWDYSQFKKEDFSLIFRLKRITRVLAYSMFSTMSSIVALMGFL